MHWFCVGSLTHFPLTGQALSLVHQQHCAEPPQPPWLTSHTVLAGHPCVPPRLHVIATTAHPTESVFCPPLHCPPLQCPLLQPPLATTFKPSLLQSLSSVQRQ